MEPRRRRNILIGSSIGVKGEIVNIMPYGAFVKLEPGVEGLVHISEMSWTRSIQHPNDIVQLQQQVEVVVLDINPEKQEISLGMKQAEANPWTNVEERYPAGTKIKGKVRNMTTYGAFVELEEGIDGLLHVSDMSWTKKITHPSALLKKGDEVEAVVLNVDKERKRVALGLKQLSADPWTTDIPGRFKAGDQVSGEVTKLTSFGAFVEIDKDLEGLLHISEMSDGKVEKPEDVVKPGQKLDLRVLNVDPNERKIGLSLRTHPGTGVAQMEAEAKEKGREGKRRKLKQRRPHLPPHPQRRLSCPQQKKRSRTAFPGGPNEVKAPRIEEVRGALFFVVFRSAKERPFVVRKMTLNMFAHSGSNSVPEGVRGSFPSSIFRITPLTSWTRQQQATAATTCGHSFSPYHKSGGGFFSKECLIRSSR